MRLTDKDVEKQIKIIINHPDVLAAVPWLKDEQKCCERQEELKRFVNQHRIPQVAFDTCLPSDPVHSKMYAVNKVPCRPRGGGSNDTGVSVLI